MLLGVIGSMSTEEAENAVNEVLKKKQKEII